LLCNACPFECGVDRSKELGVCRASDVIEVSQAQLHHWEEPPISGTRGSGAVFFTHCNLACKFCQNHEISQAARDITHLVSPKWDCVPSDKLAALMLSLKQQAAHNINLVTPTHYSEQLIPVLEAARPRLGIPVVWNSNAYEKADTLRRLEGLVNVYLPDFKYWSDELARKCSRAPNYRKHASSAILEMFRQTGRPKHDEAGIIQRGTIIRHLILPGHADDSKRILEWIADAFGADVPVSLMAQYYPVHRSHELPGMNRRLEPGEYEEVLEHFHKLGLEGFTQQLSSATRDYTPTFDGKGL